MQVNDATQLHWYWFGADGMPKARPTEPQYLGTCPWPVLGPIVKHFSYDGVGRMFRVSTPMSAEWFGGGLSFSGSNGFQRSERFYYDGVRRIGEAVTDLVLTNEVGDVVSIAGAMNQNGVVINGQHNVPYARMEYVWGPGDGHAGVYELHAQISRAGNVWYVAQDAQSDVLSMMEKVVEATNNVQVVAQWTY